MKKYDINISIAVELEDDTDLSGVLSSLMYVPDISGCTAKLTGLNMFKVQPSMISGASAGQTPIGS